MRCLASIKTEKATEVDNEDYHGKFKFNDVSTEENEETEKGSISVIITTCTTAAVSYRSQ